MQLQGWAYWLITINPLLIVDIFHQLNNCNICLPYPQTQSNIWSVSRRSWLKIKAGKLYWNGSIWWQRYVEIQNLEMALHSCQGTAFLSHPQCNSLAEMWKRRKGSLMFYKYSVVSQNLRAAHRDGGGSLACVCFQASNITRGRSHWKSCWKHCQLMSPIGTLLARWGWLEHYVPLLYQRVPHLWLAGSRWCTAGSGYTSQTLCYITGNVK